MAVVKIYQYTLSPDHSWLRRLFPYGYCRFHPSCSQYTYLALKKYGFIKGLWKGFVRVLKCNPWNNGGIDNP